MCPALSCAFPRSSEFIGCNLPRLSRMPRRRAVAIGVLPEPIAMVGNHSALFYSNAKVCRAKSQT